MLIPNEKPELSAVLTKAELSEFWGSTDIWSSIFKNRWCGLENLISSWNDMRKQLS